MISIYTNQFRTRLVEDYIKINLVSFLIQMPSLGITDSPTPTELNNRLSLTMSNAVAQEIGATNLYGYKRNIITTSTSSEDLINRVITVTVTSTFTANGGSIGPASHICYARGADVLGASASNGNNRGSTIGTLIKVEPLVLAPYTIANGVTFTHNTSFIVSTRIL
ncbi:hypothetical protein H6G33_10690 [Calothrix sp. FACHB-1219]|uniref:hypothetical protein n=1 Tax=unclassified Calothrix TaxID=2619626 RepID=UPI0016880E56|nr:MULTISPECIES: hypothetical protein [unclassified Calothrix]MBD2201815.1 hypothetical protein [Calothrix sp. FACHB-168]MBD2217501.1 hypothetical protein [Calothrix sp. FACHB-1219]